MANPDRTYNPEGSKAAIQEAVTAFKTANPLNSSEIQEVIELFNGQGDNKHHVGSIFTMEGYLALDDEYTQTGMSIPEVRNLIEALEKLGFEHNHT